MLDNILRNKVRLKRGYKIILLMVFVAAFNISCGKKGPLYISGKAKPVEVKSEAADKKAKVTDNGAINSDTNKVDVNTDAILKVK